jgi:hypothetical protein
MLLALLSLLGLAGSTPPFSLAQPAVTGVNTTGTSIAVTLAQAPTVGNLLIGRVATNDGSFTDPTGWNRVATGYNATEDDTSGIVWRQAQSGDSATVTFTGFVGNTKLVVVEERFIPAGGTVVVDESGSSAREVGVTTKDAGTSGALDTAVEFACAVIAIRALTSANAATAPFSLDAALNNASGFSGNFLSDITDSTAAVTPTSSWTTAGTAWGCFATFKYTIASGSPYTLVADPATYTVSAAPATLAAARSIDAQPAAYTYTAQAAQLIAGRAIIASAAAYTVVASSAELLRSYALTASPAAYSVTAFDASLSRGRAVSADPAAYAVAAQPATLAAGRNINASPAAYVVTADATLSTARSIVAAPAAYTVAAQDATLTAARALSAEPAAYVLTAFDADLTESGGAGLTLDAQPAAYAVAAFDTGLASTNAINAAAAAYTVSADAALAADRNVNAQPAAYAVTGADAGIAATRSIDAGAAAYTVSADATLAADRSLNAAPSAYLLTAADAGLASTKAINAAAAAYAVSSPDAELLTGGGTDVLTSTDLANITAIVDARVDELQKIWLNKMTTDPATGLLTIYDNDNTTPLWQGPIYEDVPGTQPYRGRGAERRDKLT